MRAVDPFRLIGTIVDGRYRVDSVAGHGGHGVVYRAFHLTFESVIALKVLRLPSELTSSERAAKVAAFRREGKVLFELSGLHVSIVKAFETGVVTFYDGAIAPYLALEWLDGVSLDREVKYRRECKLPPFSLTEIFTLLDPAARALALAHARGVAHRDIKPGNLFVAQQGGRRSVKVLDFGIAKILDDSLTRTATLVETGGARSSFTPMYGAPEQWLRRLGATGPWTDVHAFALVCVELLTGKAPFIGDEPAHLMAACLDAAVRPTPKSLGYDAPEAVEAVFVRGLALEPRERFRDMAEFWSALTEAAQFTAADAKADVDLKAFDARRPPEPETDAVMSHAAPGARTVTGTTVQHRPPSGQDRARVKWLTLLGACVLAVASVVVASQRNSPPATPDGAAHETATASAIERTSEPESLPTAAPSAVLPVEPGGETVPSEPEAPPSSSERKTPRGRASPGDSATANGGAPAASVDRTRSPDGVPAGAPHAAPIASSRRAAAAAPATSAAATLEQLIENEELLHRR